MLRLVKLVKVWSLVRRNEGFCRFLDFADVFVEFVLEFVYILYIYVTDQSQEGWIWPEILSSRSIKSAKKKRTRLKSSHLDRKSLVNTEFIM